MRRNLFILLLCQLVFTSTYAQMTVQPIVLECVVPENKVTPPLLREYVVDRKNKWQINPKNEMEFIKTEIITKDGQRSVDWQLSRLTLRLAGTVYQETITSDPKGQLDESAKRKQVGVIIGQCTLLNSRIPIELK